MHSIATDSHCSLPAGRTSSTYFSKVLTSACDHFLAPFFLPLLTFFAFTGDDVIHFTGGDDDDWDAGIMVVTELDCLVVTMSGNLTACAACHNMPSFVAGGGKPFTNVGQSDFKLVDFKLKNIFWNL